MVGIPRPKPAGGCTDAADAAKDIAALQEKADKLRGSTRENLPIVARQGGLPGPARVGERW